MQMLFIFFSNVQNQLSLIFFISKLKIKPMIRFVHTYKSRTRVAEFHAHHPPHYERAQEYSFQPYSPMICYFCTPQYLWSQIHSKISKHVTYLLPISCVNPGQMDKISHYIATISEPRASIRKGLIFMSRIIPHFITFFWLIFALIKPVCWWPYVP